MSTITAILEAAPDGTLHLPVPEELRAQRVRVVATLEAVELPSIAMRERVIPPDFAAIRRVIFGSDLAERRLAPEDSAFIRDRGEQ